MENTIRTLHHGWIAHHALQSDRRFQQDRIDPLPMQLIPTVQHAKPFMSRFAE
jgi:hypothetical protein